jgi:predicted site-specific integrase-resolvase
MVEYEQKETGTIIVKTNHKTFSTGKVALYGRVSSHEKKEDLDRQMQRLRNFASSSGFIVTKEVKEIASGMNDNRPKLNQILLDESFKTIIVENKDRLTRFGFNYIKGLTEMQDRKIIVINEDKNEENDLLKDFISIITSFCCRLYGLRKGQKKAEKIKKELC